MGHAALSTNLACGATLLSAMPGTDLAYGPTVPTAMPSTDLAHGPFRDALDSAPRESSNAPRNKKTYQVTAPPYPVT
eukprot:1924214-Rhodomonas_salina.7